MTAEMLNDEEDARDERTAVDKTYEALKALVIDFHFHAGERLNEGEIARRLGVSRTPVREALNRLNIEGLITCVPRRGFFCREADPKQIYDLFKLRSIIETAAVRLAIDHSETERIDHLASSLGTNGAHAALPLSELIRLDEQFHEHLVSLSGNRELVSVIRNVNDKIRFVRYAKLAHVREKFESDHYEIVRALAARDGELCVRLLDRHIEYRMDQVVVAIRKAMGCN